MEGRQPEWADIYSTPRKHPKPGKRAVIDYLVCNNLATLIYIINLGCVDVNPWTARTVSPKEPDYIAIDLDPSDEDFTKAIEAAKASKQFFDEHKLKAFVKTSGKTGLHLVIPCRGFTFKAARRIAENICSEVHLLIPEITTTEVSIAKRGTNLYLDPNQNDEADTIASAYSVRPFKEPNVSTPLEWREVNDRLNPFNFNIHTILSRVEKKGDPWYNFLDDKVAIKNTQILQMFLPYN
jgi:bifunctional non-homologous end joining protein LigD